MHMTFANRLAWPRPLGHSEKNLVSRKNAILYGPTPGIEVLYAHTSLIVRCRVKLDLPGQSVSARVCKAR